MEQGISRRSLFKLGGIAAIGAAGAGALAGCGTTESVPAGQAMADVTTAAGHDRSGLPSFFDKPAPIKDVAETKDYDIVVIGAGAPGVPCALAAAEAGAKVALIQKEATASAYGNSGSGIDYENSDPADVAALVNVLMKDSQHRPNRKLLEMWARMSGEAVKWVVDRAAEGGAQVIDQGNEQHKPLLAKTGYNLSFVTSYFGPKPYTTAEGMAALCTVAEKAGVEIFYSTPAEQLVQDDAGKMTGVIAKSGDSHIQFNASKGVVMATGDYQNDTEMLYYYLPDMRYMAPKQSGRTGDGQKMVVWAGGCMENLNHTKMLHDFDAGPASMCDMPFLRTKLDGTRFCNETVEMSLMNCYLLGEKDQGSYTQVFDSAYMDKAASFPGKLIDPEAIRTWMPEENVERTGVIEGYLNTYKADTLEELAKKLEVTDADAFVATVKRFNELCDAGADEDFGLPKEYLQKIDTPPYYGIHRHVRMSAIASGGVVVDENLQCLTPEGAPIEGLYAIGNVAGGFYGGVDYPLTVFGLNLGHNYTQGYVVGKALAAK